MPMLARALQDEKPYPRDPTTHIIYGAEPFDLWPGGRPDETGKAGHAILFLHGWTSTPRELRFLAARFAERGYRCLGPLLKGHGLTVRALSAVRFRDHLEEAEEAFGKLALLHDRVSVCGLSMGGLLALHLAIRRRVANLVLIAPFVRPAGTTMGLPNRWLVGRVPLPSLTGKDAAGPIDDPRGAEGHIAYHAMPSAAMESVVKAARGFQGLAQDITCPALLLHAVGDRTSAFAGSQDLVRDLGSADKTLVAFNRGNHVITLDYERQRVEDTALAWMEIRKG